MTLLGVILGVAAGWLATSGGPDPLRRLGGAAASPAGRSSVEPSAKTGTLIEHGPARVALCLCSGAAAGLAIAGAVGGLLGGVAGAAAGWQIGRLEQPSARRRREAVDRDFPLAVDLLAACALAGRPVEQSLDIVASAVGGPVAEVLHRHTARVLLGADPAAQWSRLRADEQFGPLARTLLRSLESGAPVVEGLRRLGDDTRRERAVGMQKRARSVGVQAAGPLAACFLPAFMVVGIVPTIVGGFEHLVL
jgi:Flp pilus assembly protein TadB